RMGEKSAQNILDSIEAAKHPTLARLLFALGIPNIGEHTGELIAERFGTLKAIQAATLEEISSIHDVGKIAGLALRTWLDEPHNQALLEKLQAAGVEPVQEERKEADERFAGKSFVFTGTMSRDRRDLEAMVKDLGARVSGSVSKKTSYVVAGEAAGSKLDKARDNKVTILTEDEFMALISSDAEPSEAPAPTTEEAKPEPAPQAEPEPAPTQGTLALDL
ncbi:NAD-dependent DNA ligase LigA, partial [bacterium]